MMDTEARLLSRLHKIIARTSDDSEVAVFNTFRLIKPKAICWDNSATKAAEGEHRRRRSESPRKGFCGRVVIQARCQARAYAATAVERPELKDALILWADGSLIPPSPLSPSTTPSSRSRSFAGAGVVCLTPLQTPKWANAFCFPEVEKPGIAELFAIKAALQIAVDRLGCVKKTIVFSDAQGALKQISKFPYLLDGPDSKIMESIMEQAIRLHQLGVEVELHWVPGHSGVEGNELADRMAGVASCHLSCLSEIPSGMEMFPVPSETLACSDDNPQSK